MNAARRRLVIAALGCFASFLSAAGAKAEETLPDRANTAEHERVAVLMLVDHDANLSDNLTEVAITTLAGTPDWDFIGLGELRERLAKIDLVAQEGLGACLASGECRRKVVQVAEARRAAIGHITRDRDGYALELFMTAAAPDDAEIELSGGAPHGVTPLVTALRAATQELLTRTLASHAAEASDDTPSTPPPKSAAPQLSARPRRLVEPRGLLPLPPPADRVTRRATPGARYVTYTAAGLGVLSFVGAAVFSSMSTGAPEGDTRAAAQADFDRRVSAEHVAVGLLIGGAVCAAVTAVSLAVH